jgi:hypothetical protein
MEEKMVLSNRRPISSYRPKMGRPPKDPAQVLSDRLYVCFTLEEYRRLAERANGESVSNVTRKALLMGQSILDEEESQEKGTARRVTPGSPRNRPVMFWIRPEDKEKVRSRADAGGISMSEMGRELVLLGAKGWWQEESNPDKLVLV